MRLPAMLLVVSMFLAGAACGAPSPSLPATASTQERLTLKLETAHVRVMADRAAVATLRQVADAIEANYSRIAADLGGTDLRVITASVWADAESCYRAMEATIGRRFEGAGGYVAGPADLRILDGPRAAAGAVHEMAHCVTLRTNPTIGNNPRWLWETVAIYESGERVDPGALARMKSGSYPTIAQLNADPDRSHQVYEVGYVLGEFIVTRWGRDALVRLVQANGNIERVLGISVAEFERRWYAFVEEKYLQPR